MFTLKKKLSFTVSTASPAICQRNGLACVNSGEISPRAFQREPKEFIRIELSKSGVFILDKWFNEVVLLTTQILAASYI